MPVTAKKPLTAAERMEHTSRELATRLFDRRMEMRTALGGRGYKAQPLSGTDKLNRYSEVRNDSQAWTDLMKQNFKVKEDGRILVPKGMLQELGKMEQTFREGVL